MIVKYITILTNDVVEQAALFTTILGFQLSGQIELWPGVKCEVFNLPDNELSYVIVPQQRAPGARSVNVLSTDNCLRSFNKLKNKGMKVVSRPYYLPEGMSAILEDKAGNQYILLEERIYEEI